MRRGGGLEPRVCSERSIKGNEAVPIVGVSVKGKETVLIVRQA